MRNWTGVPNNPLGDCEVENTYFKCIHVIFYYIFFKKTKRYLFKVYGFFLIFCLYIFGSIQNRFGSQIWGGACEWAWHFCKLHKMIKTLNEQVHRVFYMPWGHSVNNCRRSGAAITLLIRAEPAVLVMELSFPHSCRSHISLGRFVCSHTYKSPSMKAHTYSGHLIMSLGAEDPHNAIPNGRNE